MSLTHLLLLAQRVYAQRNTHDLVRASAAIPHTTSEQQGLAWAMAASMHHPDVRAAVAETIALDPRILLKAPYGSLDTPNYITLTRAIFAPKGYKPGPAIEMADHAYKGQDQDGAPIYAARGHIYYPIQDLRTAERDFHITLGAPSRDGPSETLPLHKVFEPLPTKPSKAKTPSS